MATKINETNELPTVVYGAKGNAIDTSGIKSSDSVEQPQVVYMARPHEPIKPQISEAVRAKHDESTRLYPYLNLSDGEYVISAVKRHPIGLIQIWAVVFMAVAILGFGIVGSMNGASNTNMIGGEQSQALAMILLGMIALVFLGGIMATVVYEGNRFFLTNESVTQHIQISLFSKKEQTISLVNIEDASFRQHGIIQTFLNYGSIRLSTQGEETTYRFNFVADPAHQIALLNDAVEAFKNGRPIEDN